MKKNPSPERSNSSADRRKPRLEPSLLDWIEYRLARRRYVT